MSQLTEEEYFHAGLVCDSRPEAPGADRVQGMYLNTLPFAADRTARTWHELVEQVFAREVELWSHRRYPGRRRSSARRPAVARHRST